MKIFIDTANVDEIRTANSWGVIDGVTTNPSLVAKEGRNHEEVLKEICGIVDGPVSAEVIATDTDGMIEEGRELAKIHKNIHIKIPIIEAGLPAIKTLNSEGIRINCTLIFSPNQALLAAKAGATFVSPFIGRLDDLGQEGMQIIRDIKDTFKHYPDTIKSEILVSSIRHPMHMVEAAKLGGDIATIPFKVIQQMLKHPMTDIGLKKFLADYEASKKVSVEKVQTTEGK